MRQWSVVSGQWSVRQRRREQKEPAGRPYADGALRALRRGCGEPQVLAYRKAHDQIFEAVIMARGDTRER